MMKSLIITVAGTSTRFNKDTDKETLKCIYYIINPRYSLLYQILDKSRDIDEIIIVGGYLYEDLSTFILNYLKEFSFKIKLVYNPCYMEYGSGYSLIKGIESVSKTCSEVLFVEGDLYFDKYSFDQIKKSKKDVLTVNHDFITSRKAVALYISLTGHIHYIYDTAHESLRINEPFDAIYNSAQIWKFQKIAKLYSIISSLTLEQTQSTNLEIIQAYFSELTISELDLISVAVWHNCNTVLDYQKVYSLIKL